MIMKKLLFSVAFPGLPMDCTYNPSVTATDSIFNNLNYVADSAKIYIDNVTGIESAIKHITNSTIYVYPNPFSNNFNISVEIEKSSNVTIELYNFIGEKIQSVENNFLQNGKHDYYVKLNENATGIYLLKVTVDGKTQSSKLIKIN